MLNDPLARQYVRELPYHGYDFVRGPENFDKLAALHDAYPDLRLWMTEVCHFYEEGKPHTTPIRNYAFGRRGTVGDMIVSDIGAGAPAWVNWNTILDQQGGPWMVSVVHLLDPNVQQPLVVIDRKTKKVSYTGLYYYLAHFSKFVRPGALRVPMDGNIGGTPAGVAFLSPEREEGWHWVVELLNDRPADTPVQVDFELNTVHRSLQLTLPAISITDVSFGSPCRTHSATCHLGKRGVGLSVGYFFSQSARRRN